ncbi:SDR family NAD(P)-dependent oxidoreductase (plasmid) [Diaphorobacter sp. HDW4B]|uniref:SDR family NAD(P)-dependent oxidoreductase n=1 Tax=Diaphorobacter sp. HDW4B TaxID=2714925 RepID=UPI00140CE232|nr:SDR family NAD(P)-dependent oxidoreductase [Diaphorobacter sp. HDW4B]QIL73987.1 SDR family NAD(P)-dependent oxidoreductase [Diaphorobacter sp. HDW4B]
MVTLLVTGAARGIGHTVVERALARGDTVFAVVRKAADASKFSQDKNLHVVLMDMADTASVARGFGEVDRILAGRPLNAIVHCAAISIPGAIELTPVEEFEQIINTNTIGSLRILKAAIPRLRGHGGRLVLVTSLWGQASGALLGAYCASKHAIESLADVARRETKGMNLRIIVAEPGVVQTDMLTTQGPAAQAHLERMQPAQRGLYGNLYQRYFKLVSNPSGITSEACAKGIEQALNDRRPALRYRIGADSKAVCMLNALLPSSWMDWVMGLSLNHKPLSK